MYPLCAEAEGVIQLGQRGEPRRRRTERVDLAFTFAAALLPML